MTRDEAYEAFTQLATDLAETFLAKNADYAVDSDPWHNFRECERAGIPMLDGLLTRMGDKWARYLNVYRMRKEGKRPNVRESLKETRRDLIVYLMCVDIIEEALLKGENSNDPREQC